MHLKLLLTFSLINYVNGLSCVEEPCDEGKYVKREKGRNLTQSYDKNPYTHINNPKNNVTTKNATKNSNCTTIADRLRTVNRSNDSYPTGVFKPIYGIPTFPLISKAVQSKGHIFKNVYIILLKPRRTREPINPCCLLLWRN